MLNDQLQLKQHFAVSQNQPEIKDEIPGEDMLLLVAKCFETYKVPFFLIFGTALGIYRDKQLITHDYDIDCGVPADYVIHFKKVCLELEKQGFFIEEITHDKIKMCYPKCRYDLDIWFITRTFNPIYYLLSKKWICGDAHLKNSFFAKEHRQTVSLKNNSFMVPYQIEDYLAELYGYDWRTPKKGCYAIYRRLPSQIIHYVCVDSPLPIKYSAIEELCTFKPWLSWLLLTFFPNAKITYKYKHPK